MHQLFHCAPNELKSIHLISDFENSFEAKVKELIYLGDHIRTRVKVCGDDQFIVKVPNILIKDQNLKEGTCQLN